MSILGDLIIAIATILDKILDIYIWVIIIAALISWVSPDPYNPVVRFLRAVTEPVLNPIRRAIGYRLGPIDISPVVVIFAIMFAQMFLIKSLIKLGLRLGGD